MLAGGQSLRMGSDKALALFAGTPLIENALGILSTAGLRSGIAGARSDLTQYAAAIPDTIADVGPLGGIHAALSVSHAEWNLFLPVDMALMPASLLRLMLERARQTGAPVTATRLNGRLEPYPVLLHQSVLTGLTAFLGGGRTAGYQAWPSLAADAGSQLDCPDVESLVQCGQCTHPLGLAPFYWFKNANTAWDLARMNRLHMSFS